MIEVSEAGRNTLLKAQCLAWIFMNLKEGPQGRGRSY